MHRPLNNAYFLRRWEARRQCSCDVRASTPSAFERMLHTFPKCFTRSSPRKNVRNLYGDVTDHQRCAPNPISLTFALHHGQTERGPHIIPPPPLWSLTHALESSGGLVGFRRAILRLMMSQRQNRDNTWRPRGPYARAWGYGRPILHSWPHGSNPPIHPRSTPQQPVILAGNPSPGLRIHSTQYVP